MQYIGTNLSIALGAWRLRFVLMLEDADERETEASRQAAPHHLTARTAWDARARRT
jgi:hypothetical protein